MIAIQQNKFMNAQMDQKNILQTFEESLNHQHNYLLQKERDYSKELLTQLISIRQINQQQ